MAGVVTNKAEIEYAVMLAVLDFQTEFVKSNYLHVRVNVFDDLIYVTSTRSVSIPAEKELARSPEGLELLRRFYRAMFDSCQHILRARIEQAIGETVQNIVTDLDPKAGLSTVVIKLFAPMNLSSIH